MSKHPLGPWTQTVRNDTLYVSGAPVIYSDGGTSPTSNFVARFSEARTGWNSGGPTSVPRPASLDLVDTEYKGFVASAEQYKGSRPWKTVSCKGGFVPPFQSSKVTTIISKTVLDESFNRFIQKQGATFKSIPFIGQFKSFKDDVRAVSDLITGRHNKSYLLLVKNLLKAKKGSAKDLMRVVSDHWLTYQFGILPDLSDMSDLLEAFKLIFNQDVPKLHIHGSYKDKEVNSSSKTQVNASFGVDVINNLEYTVIGKTGATYKVIVPNKDQALAHVFGADFGDFIPSLWELLPYSWLVDYFLNIGDFIDLLSLHRGVFENGWQVLITNKLETSLQTPVNYGDVSYRMKSGNTGFVTKKTFAFQRSLINVDTYLPSLAFTVPDLRKAANIAAVATTNLIKPNSINNIIGKRILKV